MFRSNHFVYHSYARRHRVVKAVVFRLELSHILASVCIPSTNLGIVFDLLNFFANLHPKIGLVWYSCKMHCTSKRSRFRKSIGYSRIAFCIISFWHPFFLRKRVKNINFGFTILTPTHIMTNSKYQIMIV